MFSIGNPQSEFKSQKELISMKDKELQKFSKKVRLVEKKFNLVPEKVVMDKELERLLLKGAKKR